MLFWKKKRVITIGQGRFYCPECRSTNDYLHKKKKTVSFSLSIPFSTEEVHGQYVECSRCKSSFRETVLESSPETARAEFHPSMKRVMILMILADGEINDTEIRSIRDIYEKVTGNPLSEQELAEDIEKARKDACKVDQYLKKVTPYLNKSGKEQVLKSAFYVATSDGLFQADEKALLDEIALALEMIPEHYEDLLKEFIQEKENLPAEGLESTSSLVGSL
ncbi:MAG: TerB family tellurite resistance protein [Proteobacteria bacterium]|nr:TerB family tellurite resistance protein [Pseudomonadota bacterium]